MKGPQSICVMTRLSDIRSSLRGAEQLPMAMSSLFTNKRDSKVFCVVTVELVVEDFLELFAPNFIVDEKTEYDETKATFGPLCNARMRAVIWRRQNPGGVGI